MAPSQVLFLAFLVGVVAGLRSLTAPAVVAWAANRSWLNLHNTPQIPTNDNVATRFSWLVKLATLRNWEEVKAVTLPLRQPSHEAHVMS